MKLLFEEYHYPKDKVMAFLPEFEDLRFVNNNNEVSIPYVGYFYSSKLDDSVFVLPKVFINVFEDENNEKGKAFGKFNPESIIDTEAIDNPLIGTEYYSFIFSLSLWIYQAIDQYKKRNSDDNITKEVDVLSVHSANGESSQTLINIVLDLMRFNKEHKDLFTFVARVSSQGHHKVNWQKTISKRQPFLQDNYPIYMDILSNKKIINYEEELIVLFFSVMDYLHDLFHIPIIRNLNYQTYPREIEKLLKTGKGTRFLRKIQHRYFKDELVRLWDLLFVYFKKEEDMKSKRITKDFLLVKDFDRVFEDMIDCLISDDTKEKDKKLKEQRDRKIVDHIYRYESLIRKDDVFYIGDSKYYQEGSLLRDEAIYKQFTYAKNVIQRAVDPINLSKSGLGRSNYYDPDTEGYNVTPNFFIRGSVKDIFSSDKIGLEPNIKNGKPDVKRMVHHKNRLFDRDTLLVLTYNINFLYVLKMYASNRVDDNESRKIRSDFRIHVRNQLVNDYNFYKLHSRRNRQEAIEKHFKLLIGKIISAFGNDDDSPLLMALEKETSEVVFREIYDKIKDDFKIIEYDLILDKEKVVNKDPAMVYLRPPVQSELQFEEDNDLEEPEKGIVETFDDVEEEKFVKFLPLYNIKAACGAFSDGEMPIVEKWIAVERPGFKPNKNHFVVYAKGDSMIPKINDGDLCVFERYSGGSRDGKIVLTDTVGTDPYYDCQFTIKQYHSEWIEIENERRQSGIVLQSLNPDYPDIQLEEGEKYETYGIFQFVI